MAIPFAIITTVCGCCSLLFLSLVILGVLVSILGHERRRKEKGAQGAGECDERGAVVDAEFKELEKKDLT